MPARLPALLADPPASSGRLWLTGCRLLDGTGAPVRESAAVLVTDGRIELVQLIYTQFLSAGTQRVAERRFLPLDPEALGLAGDAATGTHDAPAHPQPGGHGDGPTADYEYEPDPTEILDALLPRYVEARVFGALLEASASFFAAQQRAMASASDNADELITKLTRQRNRARQDSITTEIMEIVSGAEALSPQN